jgi:hypothetical protein
MTPAQQAAYIRARQIPFQPGTCSQAPRNQEPR